MHDDQQDYPESEEIEIEALGIEVNNQPVELYKLLKIANLVSGGGEAKHIISEGYVAVNGEIETRKRRKMYDGDLIEFNQEYYLVICDVPEGELPELFEEDLTQEENLVSEEEQRAIEESLQQLAEELQAEPVQEEVTGQSSAEAETDKADSEQESRGEKAKDRKKSGKGKDNSRKSIDFF